MSTHTTGPTPSIGDIRLVRARTCNGCRALEDFNRSWSCRMHGFGCDPINGVPNAPCPKPKTLADMVRINEALRRAGEEVQS